MCKSYCAIDCNSCRQQSECNGCVESEGKPFGGTCIVAECCKECAKKEREDRICALKGKIIDELNALGISNMPKVSELYSLHGAYINLEYTLPSGQRVKFWDDDRVYLGNQLEKKDSDRCYGIVADESFILVCEYGCEGSNPEIVLFKKR